MTGFLERTTVSRKTPNDGKLEIGRDAAARLERLAGPLHVAVTGRTSPATLATITCTCRGGDRPHAHHFVQSDLLRELEAGADVELSLDEDRAIVTVQDAS